MELELPLHGFPLLAMLGGRRYMAANRSQTFFDSA
jgi:hypothetical protein